MPGTIQGNGSRWGGGGAEPELLRTQENLHPYSGYLGVCGKGAGELSSREAAHPALPAA